MTVVLKAQDSEAFNVPSLVFEFSIVSQKSKFQIRCKAVFMKCSCYFDHSKKIHTESTDTCFW